MHTGLLILQIIFSIGIIVAVLLQPEGTGLGSTWGGGGDTYHTKRGVEKVLFYATIVLIALFTLTSVLQLVL
ncbi:MAG: preprotein translocase subunit SecG [Pseudomonadales bacterium]|nr:preprotein translocase subunit SecG [Candidatus Woesebacteria bacterium]MCB9800943.1 preprotein translocase subunit SecG [Pseudomonadales bacterium]